MINPRLAIQIPLFLLGSCAPITPSTNITVITSMPAEQIVKERKRLASAKEFEKAISAVDASDCTPLTKQQVENYKYPPFPDLSKLPPGDDAAIANALADYALLLRGELGILLTQAKCTQLKDE